MPVVTRRRPCRGHSYRPRVGTFPLPWLSSGTPFDRPAVCCRSESVEPLSRVPRICTGVNPAAGCQGPRGPSDSFAPAERIEASLLRL